MHVSSATRPLILFIFFIFLILSSCTPATETTQAPTQAQVAPTKFAFAVTSTPHSTTQPTLKNPIKSPTNLPSETPSPTPSVGPSSTPTLTPTPAPPLPLRDDLPPLTLKDFQRPASDNGLGIHFLSRGYYDEAELDKEIARMQSLHLKWALVIYADENQLDRAAKKFKAAGITAVWRKALRPYQRYQSWGRDVKVLLDNGVPPYMQLYNEPELPAEWDDRTMDRSEFTANLMQAAKDVYNAQGYPGIQFIDDDWLRDFITQVYARQGEPLFHRMFFVAHAYGLNHPPDYAEDMNGVLGFVTFAQIFQRRLGFIPPFVVGEGGWKIESKEDNRFPPVDDTLHRDYALAVFDWFRTGKMSNGNPLPDYLFAFCPWMLAGGDEAGAWYDSFTGERTLTIRAVQQMPMFVRKFSWDK